MNIVGYDLYSIVTSHFRLDGGAMFGIIPKPLWSKKMPSDDLNRIQMVTRSLLLVDHERCILIDTGNGNKWSQKFKQIYEIDTDHVNLEKSLAEVGYRTEDITDVICTHLHFDHSGGNTKTNNNKIVPTFSNAKYWIHQDNWTLANSPSEKDQGSFMQDDWSVLADNNQINLVTTNEQFIPNIDFIVSNGHTKGMLLPIISDKKSTLIYCADLIPTSAHIPLAWVMAYDIQSNVTIQEKNQLYSDAVNNNWIIFFEHDPEIQACTVQYDGKQFKVKDIVEI